MGVKGLWEGLEPVRAKVALSELKGQRLAVDLSCWIVQSKSIPGLPDEQPLRSLFYRITRLMRLDVKLVFVLDGTPPKLKQRAMEQRQSKRGSPSKGRQIFNQSQQVIQLKELIQALGLPCLQATGEAEALCATLSSQGLVDGCLTEDGDALLYGAKRVYRNLSLDKQKSYVDSFSMAEVTERLGLTRDDLIALALLTGCDYDLEGVKYVGVDKAVRLIEQLKEQHIDALKRICEWRNCPDLDELSNKHNDTVCPQHCGKCRHLGTKPIHKSAGCTVCQSEKGCIPDNGHQGNKPLPCPCDWHMIDGQWKLNHLEFSIREKALQYESFPNMEIVAEFQQIDPTPIPDLKWYKPILRDALTCKEMLGWSVDTMLTKFLPTLVWCDLKAREDIHYFTEKENLKNVSQLLQPKRIVKSFRKDFKDCYEVTWKKLDSDKWSDSSLKEYTSRVEAATFSGVFPQITELYEKDKEEQKCLKKKKDVKGKKRRSVGAAEDSPATTKITNFFSKKKKSSPR